MQQQQVPQGSDASTTCSPMWRQLHRQVESKLYIKCETAIGIARVFFPPSHSAASQNDGEPDDVATTSLQPITDSCVGGRQAHLQEGGIMSPRGLQSRGRKRRQEDFTLYLMSCTLVQAPCLRGQTSRPQNLRGGHGQLGRFL